MNHKKCVNEERDLESRKKVKKKSNIIKNGKCGDRREQKDVDKNIYDNFQGSMRSIRSTSQERVEVEN